MACVGGGININWLVLAAVCCVLGLVSGGGAGGGGVGVALLVVGGAGVRVVLAGGLGALVGRLGVACVGRAFLAVPGWLWCRGVGGRRPHGRSVGLWSVCYGWLLVDGARWYGMWVWGAAGGGGALLLGPGLAGVRGRLPAGPWGCTVVRRSV